MPELDEDVTMVYIWENGERHRVLQSRNPNHVAWKLHHHRKHRPEVETRPYRPPSDRSAAPLK